jgi:hypothetical protein
MLESSIAYKIGWIAFEHGQCWIDNPNPNPYTYDSPEWWEWFRGNRDAMDHYWYNGV